MDQVQKGFPFHQKVEREGVNGRFIGCETASHPGHTRYHPRPKCYNAYLDHQNP